MLKMVKNWHSFANGHSGYTKIRISDSDWDPYLGSKFVRARLKYLHEIEVMDADGRASEDIGLLFAASANSITALYWAIFEVLSRPDLLARVCEIARSAYNMRAQYSESTKLGVHPLLQSIFAEVTRLPVVGIIPRFIVGGDLQLGEWYIPEGSVLEQCSRTGAMKKNVWNAGTEDNPHPLEKSWAERFLIYPNEPNRRPLRQQETVPHSSKQESDSKSSSKETKAQGEPGFSLKGLDGVYTVFGGGPWRDWF